jgi:glycosyltransferase involved in cell wall biosynthesis
MDKIDVSVVVPVYGCRAALEELYERTKKTLKKLFNSYEIILVNDNCPQNSWEVIEQICKKDKNVIGLEMSRNFGQMKAILAGLDISKGNYVVVMDCDLQDRPEEIEPLFNKLQEGYDVVFARRQNRNDSKNKIKISKMFYKFYTMATGQEYDPALCNFSISRREIINNYCLMREEHRAFVLYLKWMGYKQSFINVQHDARKEGKSSYNFKKRMKLAMDILFSQSDKLLKIIVGFGFIISFLSFLSILIIIILHFAIKLSMGWPSLIITICLMGGINILVIGIVGLYVGNIFIQVKNRPLYFIRTILNNKGEMKNDTI